MNRVRSTVFPNTVSGVIFEAWQFEPVLNGWIWAVQPSPTAYQAATEALAGADPTGGALFFYNPAKAWSDFLMNRRLLTIIGNHYFYR